MKSPERVSLVPHYCPRHPFYRPPTSGKCTVRVGTHYDQQGKMVPKLCGRQLVRAPVNMWRAGIHSVK